MDALSGGFVEVVPWRRLAEWRLDWSFRFKGYLLELLARTGNF